MMNFTGNKDQDYLILQKLEGEDLLNICMTSKYFKNLCDRPEADNLIWKPLFSKDFGEEKTEYFSEKSWKDNYLLAISDPTKYNKELVEYIGYDLLNYIIRERYPKLPRWVDRDLFYEDMRKELIEAIIDFKYDILEGNTIFEVYKFNVPSLIDYGPFDIGHMIYESNNYSQLDEDLSGFLIVVKLFI